MNCPQCHHALRDTARFCDNCGLFASLANAPTERIGDPSITASLVGQILDSKYELIALLGHGSMGAVYRARRLHLAGHVAIKVLRPELLADEQAVERFRREAVAASQLNHPNIVTIHDFSEAKAGSPAYIVMELVEGESLRALLQIHGRPALERVVSLMRDICVGVGAAHRRQILHRDLKPDNVIVLPPDEDRERETAKVVDFGLAKLRDLAASRGHTLTQMGVALGTPYYMSPEQCRGEQLDARTDVYSLGAMLYEMLAGGPPFTATSMASLVTKHLHEAPPPLPAHLLIPTELEGVCRRALSKDPDQRQNDAAELGREIREAVGAPVSRRPLHEEKKVTADVTARQPIKRLSTGALIGVIAVLGLVVFTGAVVYLSGRKTESDNTSNSNTALALTTPTQPTPSPQPITVSEAEAMSHYEKAREHDEKKEYKQAIAEFNEAIRLDPTNPRMYTGRSATYLAMRRFDLAIADCNEATSLDPTYSDAYSNRGLAYSYKGKLDQAISDLDKAISLDPAHPDAYFNRALAHISKGNYDQAIADFTKVIERNPADAEAYHRRSLVYLKKGDRASYKADHEKAEELDPKYK